MKNPNRQIPILTLILFAAYFVLPICFPSFATRACAQDPIPVSRDSDPNYEPERVELEDGGHKLVYKNNDGIIWKEEEFALGVLIRRRTVLQAYPSGQEAEVKFTENIQSGPLRQIYIKYDRRGNPTERRTITYEGSFYVHTFERWSNRLGTWLRIVRHRTNINNSDFFMERWNDTRREWETVSEPPPASGHKSVIKVGGGLITTTFETPYGKINFNLPDNLMPGETVTGSTYFRPSGTTPKNVAVNSGKLSGYLVEMAKHKTRTDSKTFKAFKWRVPASPSGTVALVLKNKKGKEVSRTKIPVFPFFEAIPKNYQLPEMGQQGNPVTIKGSFDGDYTNTKLEIGGEVAQVIAESPRKMVAFNASKKIGLREIVVNERGVTAKGTFRNLGIALSAQKLDLLKGEQTILTIKVIGLAGIEKPVPIVLENKSPHVIDLGGGNRQQFTIAPHEVNAGIYTTTRPITGIKRGSFTITGKVVFADRQ